MLELIHPGTVVNYADGVIQELTGKFDNATGLWMPSAMKYYVYLPHDDKGRVVKRRVSEELAFQLDWIKVGDKILQEWKENRLSSMSIKQLPIEQLVAAVGAVRIEVNPAVVINGQPQQIMIVEDEYKPRYEFAAELEVIEVAAETQDVVEKSEE